MFNEARRIDLLSRQMVSCNVEHADICIHIDVLESRDKKIKKARIVKETPN
jgi:hypothetical protein